MSKNNSNSKFFKGYLDMVVLMDLLRHPNSGAYDLIASFHDKFTTLFSPGVIYPMLFNLEREKLIITKWDDRKKVYSITNDGKSTLHKLIKEFEDFHTILNEDLTYSKINIVS